MLVCTLLKTDNHASTPSLSFFASRMPFLLPNQQRQSIEGKSKLNTVEQRAHGLPNTTDWLKRGAAVTK